MNEITFGLGGVDVVIDGERGSIVEVKDPRNGKRYVVLADECRIELAAGSVDLAGTALELRRQTRDACEFAARRGGLEIVRTYRFPAGRSYFDRILSVKNVSEDAPLVIRRVRDCSLRFRDSFESVVFHDDNLDSLDPGTKELEYFLEQSEAEGPITYHTSLNVFMRGRDGGLFAGLKYPYFEVALADDCVALSYETNYRIAPGEMLELPVMFCGVYRKTGYTCRKELHWTPRLISTEQEEMDWGEVYAMREVVRDYIPEEPRPEEGYFLSLNSYWSRPEVRGKTGHREADAFCALFDRVKQSGCLDMVIIGSVWVGWAEYLAPCPEIESVGDDAEFTVNEHIERFVSHARRNGVALLGFAEATARVRSYRRDRPDWKYQPGSDARKVLRQNCQANDEYAEWFYRFICSAIDTCGLAGWAWDFAWVRRPMACRGERHGHEQGNCEFQQYRNVTAIIGKLRARYPKHYINIYWGLKEAGTWSHRWLNCLENIYENNFPPPPEMTAADDQRFQHWYNHNYRFFPTYMNMAQINFTEEGTWPGTSPVKRKETGMPLREPHLYSILSALNASTHGCLTDWVDLETDGQADEVFELLRQWKAWASDNMVYLRDRIDLFGQPCRRGGIDGSAHIIGDRGYIFVFNPWTVVKWGSVLLDGMVGLRKGGRFSLDEIGSSPRRRLGVCEGGQAFVFSIPPKSAMLIEVQPSSDDPQCVAAPEGVDVQPAFNQALGSTQEWPP